MRKPGVEAGILKTPPGVNIKEHASDSTLKLNSETINDILIFCEVYSVNFTFYFNSKN